MRDELVKSIAGEGAGNSTVSAALEVAAAEVDLLRIRREKERVINAKPGSLQASMKKVKPKISRKLAVLREKIELLERREGPLAHKDKILDRLKSEYQRLSPESSISTRSTGEDCQVDELMKIERYEQRALSRRRKAINRFAEVSKISEIVDYNERSSTSTSEKFTHETSHDKSV